MRLELLTWAQCLYGMLRCDLPPCPQYPGTPSPAPISSRCRMVQPRRAAEKCDAGPSFMPLCLSPCLPPTGKLECKACFKCRSPGNEGEQPLSLWGKRVGFQPAYEARGPGVPSQ